MIVSYPLCDPIPWKWVWLILLNVADGHSCADLRPSVADGHSCADLRPTVVLLIVIAVQISDLVLLIVIAVQISDLVLLMVQRTSVVACRQFLGDHKIH